MNAMASVKWQDGPQQVYDIMGEKSLLWGFGYDVALGGEDPSLSTLDFELCEIPAGQQPSCSTSGLQVKEGTSFIKYGIDPSQYNIGVNTYTLTLTLKTPSAEATDKLTLIVNATP